MGSLLPNGFARTILPSMSFSLRESLRRPSRPPISATKVRWKSPIIRRRWCAELIFFWNDGEPRRRHKGIAFVGAEQQSQEACSSYQDIGVFRRNVERDGVTGGSSWAAGDLGRGGRDSDPQRCRRVPAECRLQSH